MNLFEILVLINIIFCVVNALLYLKRATYNNKEFTYFTLYLFAIAVVQVIASILASLGIHNLFLFHFYYILQFVFLSFFYKQLLKQKWIYWVMFLVLGIVGFQFLREPGMFFIYNPLGVALTQGVIVAYSLLFFVKYLKETNDFLIINIGIFFYLLASILIFASGNLIFKLELISKLGYDLLVQLNNILYFAFQFLIFVSWLKHFSVKIPK